MEYQDDFDKFKADIKAELGKLDCKPVKIKIVREPPMLQAALLAHRERDNTWITWRSAAQGADFRGLFWGNYDFPSLRAGLRDFAKRSRSITLPAVALAAAAQE